MPDKTETVDIRGYSCPITMPMVSRRMNRIAEGEIVDVVFDDSKMGNELEQWCDETGNRIIKRNRHEEYYSFLIVKGSGYKGKAIFSQMLFILTGVRLHFIKILHKLKPGKKISYLITFVSIPEGLRAEKWLDEKGEKEHTALPVPADITAHCGVVLGFKERDSAERIFRLLQEHAFGVEEIYFINNESSIPLERS